MLLLPDAPRFALTNACVPAVCLSELAGAATVQGLVKADLLIGDGRIEAILPGGTASADIPSTNLRDGQIWPCFTDMHTHLDKGHIWQRAPNPDGSFDGALATVAGDRVAHWTAEDVRARMEFSLRTAYAHGTTLIRTHLDSLPPQHAISFAVFDEIRAEWRDRITLQAAALFTLDMTADSAFFTDLVATVKRYDGILGGVTFPSATIDTELDILFRAASDNGLDLDLHVDETQDSAVLTLKAIAKAAIRHRFEGQVTVGHCCSLARQNDETAKETIGLVAEAGIAVVSLPMCNMYLQDRHPGRTPRYRGVTLFKELAAAGVQTAVASDNTRDPFYAYGDLDPVEVVREAVRILHLDHPFEDVARIVTATPANILRRQELGKIAVGGPADLALFTARHWSEFLSRPQSDRIVLRKGIAIDRTPPDYRDLDAILAGV